jgi:hypothetical protein
VPEPKRPQASVHARKGNCEGSFFISILDVLWVRWFFFTARIYHDATTDRGMLNVPTSTLSSNKGALRHKINTCSNNHLADDFESLCSAVVKVCSLVKLRQMLTRFREKRASTKPDA